MFQTFLIATILTCDSLYFPRKKEIELYIIKIFNKAKYIYIMMRTINENIHDD